MGEGTTGAGDEESEEMGRKGTHDWTKAMQEAQGAA